MPYPQWTKCVQIEDKKYPGNPKDLFSGIFGILVAALLVPFTLMLLGIPLYLGTIAYCQWWLYDRLICLGGEQCAIGFLGSVEKPEEKSGLDAWDTDFSINLVLAPHQWNVLGDPKQQHLDIANDGIQGNLIAEQHSRIGDYQFDGHYADVGGSTAVYKDIPTLHCEFEGAGIYELLQAAKAALAIMTAGLGICWIPIFGQIACGLAAAAAFVFFYFAAQAAKNARGEPDVFDPNTGAHSKELKPGQDILLVRGDWIFDSAHEGWNELHPIKYCQLIGSAGYGAPDLIRWEDAVGPYMVMIGAWQSVTKRPHEREPQDDDYRNWIRNWCDGIGQATSPHTVHSQTLAQNQWAVHPLIDGCIPEAQGTPVR